MKVCYTQSRTSSKRTRQCHVSCLYLEICLSYLTAQSILSVTICLFLDERRSMTIRNLESAVSYSISVYALNDRGRGNNPFSFVASTLEPRMYLCYMFDSCCSLPLAILIKQ